jgi:hypothetical protein
MNKDANTLIANTFSMSSLLACRAPALGPPPALLTAATKGQIAASSLNFSRLNFGVMDIPRTQYIDCLDSESLQ